jgi:SAM-dependent methyltransferase
VTVGGPAEDDWRALNRAQWDERVAVHLGPGSFYDLAPLRAGRGRLQAIEEAELGPVAGLRVLHLQCHFGMDTLALAQRGAAEVVGLDFSGRAVAAARALAAELGLAGRARFVEADLYDAPRALAEAGLGDGFDRVFTTWGTIGWLPDIAGWARVVAGALRPGGRLYFADAHPAALVFEDAPGAEPDAQPGWFAPYFGAAPVVMDDPADYADPEARLASTRSVTWVHPLSAVLGALAEAGLALDWLHEHPRLPWRMFRCLVRDADGLFTWPDRPWLPLAWSLSAARRQRG